MYEAGTARVAGSTQTPSRNVISHVIVCSKQAIWPQKVLGRTSSCFIEVRSAPGVCLS